MERWSGHSDTQTVGLTIRFMRMRNSERVAPGLCNDFGIFLDRPEGKRVMPGQIEPSGDQSRAGQAMGRSSELMSRHNPRSRRLDVRVEFGVARKILNYRVSGLENRLQRGSVYEFSWLAREGKRIPGSYDYVAALVDQLS